MQALIDKVAIVTGASSGIGRATARPEVDVVGREIQIQFSYQREDGKVITQRGSRFRVPLPVGMIEPSGPPSVSPETGAGRNEPATRPAAQPGAK